MHRLIPHCLLLIGLSGSLFFPTIGQGQQLEWAFNTPDLTSGTGYAVAVDAAGNIYLCGVFAGYVDLDPFTFNSASGHTPSGGGVDENFVAKYDANGAFLWSRNYPGLGTDLGCNAVFVDATGVYITGVFQETMEMSPTITSNGGFDAFVAKLNASTGNTVWAHPLGGTFWDVGTDVTVDASGNVYVTGYFRDTVDFDPGAGTASRTSNGLDDVFVASFTGAGAFRWARTFGGSQNDQPTGLAFDNLLFDTGLYVTGTFRQTVDFQNDLLPCTACTRTSAGEDDIFVASYTLAAGTYKNVMALGNFGYDASNDIVSLNTGDFFITGATDGPMDFNPNGTTVSKDADMFVARYTAGFLNTWVVDVLGGIGPGRALAVDGSTNVYVTGARLGGPVDFDPGPGEANVTGDVVNGDVFVAKYNTSGTYQTAFALGDGSLGASGWEDGGLGIAVDGSGNMHVTGYMAGQFDADPGAGQHVLKSIENNNPQIFLGKYTTTGTLIWAFDTGLYGADQAYSIALDATGNTYVCGVFAGYIDFAPFDFSSTAGHVPSVSAFEENFVAKYDPNGVFLWVRNYPGAGTDLGCTSVFVNATGLYITGLFQDTMQMSPTITSNGSFDAFVARLDPATGNTVWAHPLGGTFWDAGTDVKADASGNVYVTGYFRDTVDFDPGAGTASRTSNGLDDVFVASFTDAGIFRWATTFGGTEDDTSTGLAFDNLLFDTGLYVTGTFQQTVDFQNVGGACGACTRTSNGGTDIFVANYTLSTGAYQSVVSIGSFGFEEANDIAAVGNGGFFITGATDNDPVDFNPNGAPRVKSASLFVARYAVGYLNTWVAAISGGVGPGKALAVDGSQNVNVIGGGLGGPVDFDPGPGEAFLEGEPVNGDLYVARYSGAGLYQTGFVLGDGTLGASGWPDVGFDVAAAATDDVHIAGHFAGQMDADPGGLQHVLTSIDRNVSDIFVGKYNLPNSNNANLKIMLSGPYNTANGTMNTTLNTGGHLPLTQPFNTAPWNYTGTEGVDAIPPDVVDWVLVQIRYGTAANTLSNTRAGFVKKDGTIVDLDGVNQLGFFMDNPGTPYYVVVDQRNHLRIMTAATVPLWGTTALYDFTTGQAKAYGTNPMRSLGAEGAAPFALWGGDGNRDHSVSAFDFVQVWLPQNGGAAGYHYGDFNLSADVTAFDFLQVWLPANGQASQVP